MAVVAELLDRIAGLERQAAELQGLLGEAADERDRLAEALQEHCDAYRTICDCDSVTQPPCARCDRCEAADRKAADALAAVAAKGGDDEQEKA